MAGLQGVLGTNTVILLDYCHLFPLDGKHRDDSCHDLRNASIDVLQHAYKLCEPFSAWPSFQISPL